MTARRAYATGSVGTSTCPAARSMSRRRSWVGMRTALRCLHLRPLRAATTESASAAPNLRSSARSATGGCWHEPALLGPHDNVGRLEWWLRRIDRGGRVLAPGQPDQPLQIIDARDLARWLLDSALRDRGGIFNVVSRRGHATMGSLLTACQAAAGSTAELIWTSPAVIEAAGISGWSDLPLWIPPGHEYSGLHGADVERAYHAGLTCRSVEETVADTWMWMQSIAGGKPRPSESLGLSAEKEAAVLGTAPTQN